MITLCGYAPAAAQKYPERRHVRAGNRAYGKQEWAAAESEYRRALEKNPESRSAQSNLGNALYQQERWSEAGKTFESVEADYNLGNTLFKEQKLQEALEAYKDAMRADPTDMDAKFNYAYVKKLLEQQQNGGGGGEDDPQQEQQEQEEEQQQEQQASEGMSREDAAAMLEAMQAQEDRTQDKLDDARRAEATTRAVKNW